MTRRVLGAAASTLLLCLAACGGGASDDPLRPGATADEILQRVAEQLEDTDSITFSTATTGPNGQNSIAGTVTDSGSFTGTIVDGHGVAALTVDGDDVYVQGDQAFWASSGSVPTAVSSGLAGRWVKLPSAAGASIKLAVGQFVPSTMAYCLTHTMGTTTVKAPRIIAGREVVVLEDKGDRPGTVGGELHVAASGPPLPVRLIANGKRAPGVADARCGGDDARATEGELRFERFDADVKIAAPDGALDLSAAPAATTS